MPFLSMVSGTTNFNSRCLASNFLNQELGGPTSRLNYYAFMRSGEDLLIISYINMYRIKVSNEKLSPSLFKI
jgi:hypothetical protein